MYCGIIRIWGGSIMVARTRMNRSLFSLKFRRCSAYATNAEEIRVPKVDRIEMKNEFLKKVMRKSTVQININAKMRITLKAFDKNLQVAMK